MNVILNISSYLATGDSYKGLKSRFRMGTSSIHGVIKQTCNAIWTVLKDDMLPKPTADTWLRVEKGFRTRWQFPNCVGALDGKHIMIRKPFNSGSLYWCYKGYNSVVLLALVDHQYRFTFVDIGAYGSNSDGNVFSISKFGQKILKRKLNIPPPKQLPNYNFEGPMPHVIVADEAFPLNEHIMRPYPRYREASIPKAQAVFNYRLSHARMVVENSFGIFAMRWRLFDRRIALFEDKVVKASCVLHNFLTPITDQDYDDIATQLNPRGLNYSQNGILYLPRLPGFHPSKDASGIREIFKGYFNHANGALSYQNSRISYRMEE